LDVFIEIKTPVRTPTM